MPNELSANNGKSIENMIIIAGLSRVMQNMANELDFVFCIH